MKKEFKNIEQERAGLEKLAENRLERIKFLESKLDQDKINNNQLYQELNSAKEELR